MNPLKHILFVGLILSALAGCSKKELKGASYYTGDIYSPALIETAMDTVTNPAFESLISQQKILRIRSVEEFNAFASVFSDVSFDNVKLPNSSLAAIDFTTDNLYVLSFHYVSIHPDKVTGEGIEINSAKREIEWSLKLETQASGNSLSHYQRFYFLKIPKDHEDFSVKGLIYLDEKAMSFGAGADDGLYYYFE